jgi:branched-chain amino acid transport system ATP-binding protein
VTAPTEAAPLLELREVTVRYGGNVAVDQASAQVFPGRVTGLIGPNGAGKTTLFNVASGLLSPSSGHVLLNGRDVTKWSPFKRARVGLGRTFQRLELFTSLSVRDNIRVAGEFRNRYARPRINAVEEAEHVIERLGLSDLADRDVSEIPTGMARRVELARSLMSRPKVLLLDEPASGQDERESEEFGQLLIDLAADGIAIFLVEHDVRLVMQTCSFIYVLDFGVTIASGSAEEVSTNQAVLDAYLGEALT